MNLSPAADSGRGRTWSAWSFLRCRCLFLEVFFQWVFLLIVDNVSVFSARRQNKSRTFVNTIIYSALGRLTVKKRLFLHSPTPPRSPMPHAALRPRSGRHLGSHWATGNWKSNKATEIFSDPESGAERSEQNLQSWAQTWLHRLFYTFKSLRFRLFYIFCTETVQLPHSKV